VVREKVLADACVAEDRAEIPACYLEFEAVRAVGTRSISRWSARGVFGGRGVFAGFRSCFRRYSFMYSGLSIAPLPLAVAALLPIRRIMLELVPVILATPSTLAVAPAADHLVRMIPGALKQLSTVWAARKRHVYQSHGLLWRLAISEQFAGTWSTLMDCRYNEWR
jgi:hypothetical protein